MPSNITYSYKNASYKSKYDTDDSRTWLLENSSHQNIPSYRNLKYSNNYLFITPIY